MRSGTFARAAGFWALAGAMLHILSLGYLAGEFDYPVVLTGHARDVLPALLEGGPTLRVMWILYAIAPFSYIPMAVGAYTALKPYGRATTRIGLLFAVAAALANCFGALRWASLHLELARAWRIASPSQQLTLTALFDSFNSFFGMLLSGFIGEYAFAIFSILVAATVLRGGPFPRWFGWLGVVLNLLLMVFAWRWVLSPSALPLLTFIDNILYLFWIVLFGAVFLIHAKRYDEGRFRTL